jgi:tripartite-type tricarboxylate transporter receptor subunit TctC
LGVKGFLAQSYIGILGPAKLPPDIVTRLQKAVADGLTGGGTAAERLVGLGSEIATPEQLTPQGFAEFLRVDYNDMREAAKLANITPQ